MRITRKGQGRPGVADEAGAYVTDRENGWNELHPVTRIETLR
jgi:hypothetical protein